MSGDLVRHEFEAEPGQPVRVQRAGGPWMRTFQPCSRCDAGRYSTV
ncbi:hypothetical protein [Nonomuraea jabiensis]